MRQSGKCWKLEACHVEALIEVLGHLRGLHSPCPGSRPSHLSPSLQDQVSLWNLEPGESSAPVQAKLCLCFFSFLHSEACCTVTFLRNIFLLARFARGGVGWCSKS